MKPRPSPPSSGCSSCSSWSAGSCANIAPVLPSIGDEWGVSDSALTWVIAVQLLSAAVSLPAFGRLGDLYGHRRMLRIALVSVAVGSILVVVAPSFAVLLVGRFLQARSPRCCRWRSPSSATGSRWTSPAPPSPGSSAH